MNCHVMYRMDDWAEQKRGRNKRECAVEGGGGREGRGESCKGKGES